MDSIELPDTAEQVVQEETVAEQPLAEEQVEQKQPQEKSEEGNWRLIRERQKLLEKERDEARQQLQQYQQTVKPQNTPQEEEAELNPDDIPEWKHVQKEFKKIKDELNGYKRQSVESAVEGRLKSQYPDFDSIVNKDNLESLRIAYPDLAETINTSSDLYSKASAAYTMIKKMGIVPDTYYDKDKAIAQRNHGKPRPLSSVSPQEGAAGPLSKANAFADGLTTDLKKQLYQEMIDARKKH